MTTKNEELLGGIKATELFNIFFPFGLGEKIVDLWREEKWNEIRIEIEDLTSKLNANLRIQLTTFNEITLHNNTVEHLESLDKIYSVVLNELLPEDSNDTKTRLLSDKR